METANSQTIVIAPTCSLPGLASLLDDQYNQGLITSHGVYQSLHEKLEKAQKELDKGKPDRAAEKVWDFVERVNRETGKQVEMAAAAVLKDSTFCVLGTLGVDEAMLREIESLRTQVADDYQQDLIDKESVRDKLVERLEKAQEQIVKGKPDKAADELGKFIETVEKERGEHIDPATGTGSRGWTGGGRWWARGWRRACPAPD